MNVSFGMQPNPYRYTEKLAEKKEPQYVDAKSANKVLDDLKRDINREIDSAKEKIATEAAYEHINRLPDDLLKSLISLAEQSTPASTREPMVTPVPPSKHVPRPTPTPKPTIEIF